MGPYINLARMFMGYQKNDWLIRETFMKCDDYYCALEHLNTVPIISPSYFIMSGVEGN